VILRGAPGRAAAQPEEFTTRQAIAPYAPMAADAITVAAVGNGAGSGTDDTRVSDMIVARQPALFLYLGDVYNKGTPQEFADHYAPTYGRLRDVTNPVVGNHEYYTPEAAGYFSYWDNIPSYYSYDSGGWHFVALNTAASSDDLQPGSAQYEWLATDLAANTLPCTLVYAYHPRFSTGTQGHNEALAPLWSLLARQGVDVALAAHDHAYQRWQPLDGSGHAQTGGVTQFVVGTGGEGLRDLAGDPRIAAQHASHGALFLDLAADGLSYRFLNTAGRALDSGTVTCKGAATPSPASKRTPAAPVGTPDTRTLARAEEGSALAFR
jgi:hypothetical protein